MIYLGCAGWNFKDWKDIFYPKTIAHSNWIVNYSKKFNFVEIDETFEKIWTKHDFIKLAEKIDYKLKIGFKLNKSVTHLNINKSSIAENITEAKNILKKIEDLYLENWIGPINMEFPYSFVFSQNNFIKLKAIIDCFSYYSKVIEFQHKSWVKEEVIDFLSEQKIGFCLRDVPKLENLTDESNFLITSNFSYIKFYGRNAENWWQPLTQEDKTNYLYNNKQLNLWFRNINSKLLLNVEDVYLVFCNIKNCAAVENAQFLRKKFDVKPALDAKDQLELPF